MFNLVTILGPTASSKTSLAANLALATGSEVISADSRQVYKNMDIGTGKDLKDYTINGVSIPFHLIDIRNAGDKYNVFEYQKDFIEVFQNISNRGIVPILCGGTGMYIEAVLKGYKLIYVPVNEELRKSLEQKSLQELSQILESMKTTHNKSDADTVKRAIRAIEIESYYKTHPEISLNYPSINSLIVGVRFDREQRRSRISQRLKERLEQGMVDEVRALLEKGVSPQDLIYYGLEYKYLTQFVLNEISFNEMFSRLESAIHQFAKRQMTWFRGMEKKGFKINWLDGNLSIEDKVNAVLGLLKEN